MTDQNQPEGLPPDPVESDAKIIADAASDLGRQRERELNDDRENRAVDEQQRQLEEQQKQLNARRVAIGTDEAEARAREEADKKTIADADARLNRVVPGPNPPPQPPRPRVG